MHKTLNRLKCLKTNTLSWCVKALKLMSSFLLIDAKQKRANEQKLKACTIMRELLRTRKLGDLWLKNAVLHGIGIGPRRRHELPRSEWHE